RAHNPIHYGRILDLWWVFALSFLLFLWTVWLLWNKTHYGWAFTLLVGQFAVAFYGYGFAHYSFLLYPHLPLYDGFTNESMAISPIERFVAGLLLFLPSLYLVLRLFLLSKGYGKGEKVDYS